MAGEAIPLTDQSLKETVRSVVAQELVVWDTKRQELVTMKQVEADKAEALKLAESKALAESKVSMKASGVGGVVDTLDGFKVPVLNVSLPIGSALVGGVTGIVVGDVIDLVIPPKGTDGKANLLNVGVQVGGAATILKWGPGLMGSTASRFAAGLIVLRLILRIPMVLELINKADTALATPLRGLVPGGTTAAQPARAAQRVDVANAFAEQVISGPNAYENVL